MGQQPEKSIDPEELRYNQNQFRSMEQWRRTSYY
jgi:hypothetical protein